MRNKAYHVPHFHFTGSFSGWFFLLKIILIILSMKKEKTMALLFSLFSIVILPEVSKPAFPYQNIDLFYFFFTQLYMDGFGILHCLFCIAGTYKSNSDGRLFNCPADY